MYQTPENFSNMIMNSDGEYLTGLWFEDSRDSFKHIINCEEKDLEIFKETSKWLDIYFSGKNPNFTPKYKIKNFFEITFFIISKLCIKSRKIDKCIFQYFEKINSYLK